MPLEFSLIAGKFARFAGHQTSPAAGVAANVAQRQGWSHCLRTWALKAVAVRTRPGASFGAAGLSPSEICLLNNRPRLLGVPYSRARVGCPACSRIRHNTLKFIDLDQTRFSGGESRATVQ